MPRDFLSEAEGLWEYNGKPERPFSAAGEITYRGWDIADRWAIDAAMQPWATFGADGGPLAPTEGMNLVAMAESDADREAILRALGVEHRPTVVDRLRERIAVQGARIDALDREAEYLSAAVATERRHLDRVADALLLPPKEPGDIPRKLSGLVGRAEALVRAAQEVIAAFDAGELRQAADRRAAAIEQLRDALKETASDAE